MTIFLLCRLESITFKSITLLSWGMPWMVQGMLWIEVPGDAIYMIVHFRSVYMASVELSYAVQCPAFPALCGSFDTVWGHCGHNVTSTFTVISYSCHRLCSFPPCTYWCLLGPLYSYESLRIQCLFFIKSWPEAFRPRRGDTELQCSMC